MLSRSSKTCLTRYQKNSFCDERITATISRRDEKAGELEGLEASITEKSRKKAAED